MVRVAAAAARAGTTTVPGAARPPSSSATSNGESVHVCVRVRPAGGPGRDKSSSSSCISIGEDGRQVTAQIAPNTSLPASPSAATESAAETEPGRHTFAFDSVLGPELDQAAVYRGTCRSLVDEFLSGYNTTLLVYGQTGSGKTYTVMGDGTGIAYLVADHLQQWMRRADAAQYDIDVQAGFVEIYQEQIIDLLDETATSPSAAKRSPSKLRLREDPVKGVFVAGLIRREVENGDDIVGVLREGCDRRHIGSTQMNEQSSRSHSILNIVLHQRLLSDPDGLQARRSELNIVDLAGSERQSGTQAAGDRLKEGAKINSSLTALGLVIKSLADGNPHIPYRNSPLTRLLQNSLGGNARTLLIACINPAGSCVAETLSTLKFAARAKLIQCRPQLYGDPKMRRIAQLEAEIAALKDQLRDCHCQPGAAAAGVSHTRCCSIM